MGLTPPPVRKKFPTFFFFFEGFPYLDLLLTPVLKPQSDYNYCSTNLNHSLPMANVSYEEASLRFRKSPGTGRESQPVSGTQCVPCP